MAKEVMLERGFAFGMTNGTLRASLFEDDVRDTILNQLNVITSIRNIQNVERVRTRGIEFSATASDAGVKGLDLTGNLTFTRPRILENAGDPLTVGKEWVRIPRVRLNLGAAYRPNDKWMASLAVRHSGRKFANTDNSDTNPDTFGGVSAFTVWDAKATYRVARNVEASFGIDNLSDEKYYVFHPYPGRTFFGELRATF